MIARILSSILLVATLGAVLGFATAEAETRRVTGVLVDVKDEAAVAFLDADRIETLLGTTKLEGELIGNVDLQLVVNHLHDMDACRDAQVYPTMDGVLHIDVPPH